MSRIKSSNLGYPRIGENREWKKALEAFWAGKLEEADFLKRMEQIRLSHLQKQKDHGIDLIPVGDFTFYDHMLDMAVMFGLVPKRFRHEGGEVPLHIYFSMARGNQTAVACEMTKWFNTNYHYIVPEYEGVQPTLTENKPLKAYREAKEKLGIQGKPVIVGPYTFIKLSKGYERAQLPAFILQLMPLYVQILQELEQEGVEWIQFDEPVLVTSISKEEMETVAYIYRQLHEAAPQLRIMLQTYFDYAEWYPELIDLPVQGIGLDFAYGLEKNLEYIKMYGFPADKVLGVGLVDGRNVWRSDLPKKSELIREITGYVSPDRIWLQPSCSLLHVPVSVKHETYLEPEIKNALAFADEKLDEIAALVKGFNHGFHTVSERLDNSRAALRQLAQSPVRNRAEVHRSVENLQTHHLQRNLPFEERRKKQQDVLKLPLLPTTTIGSFPQTSEVRQARRKWRKGEWTGERYDEFIRKQIKNWIHIQEEIGLDVLVHGEFERTDMVEFFGEKLGGFAFTQNGWVQSYGSRCVRPPIIYGDVEFLEPMSVKESVFAQSLTEKPVKGMITGPVTILNWSFVRDDLPRQQVAWQIALALRKEVEALEASGIKMIQVDEPALREGLPLKKSSRKEYLDWAVKAFRLTTSSVKDTTQIHTHMCYCEFHDFIDSISRLDADVISIETSRSHGELVSAFTDYDYDKGIGLGVYDIHSPRIPSADEIIAIIERGLQVLEPELFWVNPDCGLKTRGVEETVASLKNMVKATQIVRNRLSEC
ncbi:5-methyltetrahydropteroyltriglutamate--homocysteine S-methyltransferase [Thermoactinomyces daqus]|jgi:5-methyltetrahydropteroyltriglutamate--homocysteine methyltransferase|uniref:5-methyltetrahydropteroyltriglutamate--homocysteine methyltransferase n=1 Tax=Thermoactinomyces daqus TaxID=1329516 RepID=A0A7W1X920_9BACL|nr:MULTISPECIES: 5-methyltetrahydropteroyltriglutamate--homocysteine S-methyltransferase [Thermoactinomyces]MBA4542288.1 5-methyltetrahydropteroyltriglutamate--homocysteine S-methyltransferase [Thermoactinomyces daqus]MBH8604384.1 5-methyltetrahydropteroyltriglutamate--homocysteine S-methyltransferase [Thermoactinomyces sp. CICC 10522]